MIQPITPRPLKSFFAGQRSLFGGAAAALLISSIAFGGCSEAAPVPTPAPSTGGTTSTGGTNSTGGIVSTGGVVSTGGTSTGGTPSTGGVSPATGGTFSTGGTASTGGAMATGGMAAIPACVTALFASQCTSCHTTVLAPTFGGLDLSGDFLPRLVDQPAKNMGVSNPGSCVAGAKLIDTATPENSVMLKKVTNTQSCGQPMPLGTGLPEGDAKTCIKNWIMTF